MGMPVNATVKIVNEYSQLVLELEGEATTEGTRIEQYTDTGGNHQRWRLKPSGAGNEGFYNIENVHSAMSIEVVGSSREPGAEIVQRPYGAGPRHRQWKLVPVTGKEDVYKIVNRNSDLVLDALGQREAPAPVKQYGPWPDDGRQQWKLIRVATTGTTTTVRSLLHAWGYNNDGQLGDGTITQRRAPEKSPYLTEVGIKSISAGGTHSLALLEDGTVWAWGSQDYYQLGNPTWEDSREPVKVRDLDGVKAISAGGQHNLALLEDGTVRSWGRDHKGQLGDGRASDKQYQPGKVVDLEQVRAVAAGDSHSLALLEDGTVWAWGAHEANQLGNPTLVDSPKPKKVLELDRVEVIAAGGWHSLAVLRDGTVRCWGYNAHGQLGVGSAWGNQYQPPKALGLGRVEAIAANIYHSLALRDDGTMWAWGYNGWGNLGDGTKTNRHSPVQVSRGVWVKAIAAGVHHSLALREDGTVWACGYNGLGQLGDGTTTQRDWPVKVLDLQRVKAIAAGSQHSLALG